MGVRQLRHPVQGVRPAGRRRATRSRRSRTPRRCTASPGSRRGCRCTSRGTWSTTTASSPRTPPTSGVQLGTINSNMFQDDDYKLGSLTHADPRRAAQGDRPPRAVHRRHAADRVARPEDLAARRHQLPRPGRPARPGRTGWPTRCGRSTRCSARSSGWCWSTSSSSRPSTRWTSPTGAPRCVHCLALGERAIVVPRHRPPRAGHQHRVHRRAAAAGRPARRLRLQLPLLRRRRPDRRARPTRSSCSGS